MFVGAAPLSIAKADYASRLENWEKWDDVAGSPAYLLLGPREDSKQGSDEGVRWLVHMRAIGDDRPSLGVSRHPGHPPSLQGGDRHEHHHGDPRPAPVTRHGLLLLRARAAHLPAVFGHVRLCSSTRAGHLRGRAGTHPLRCRRRHCRRRHCRLGPWRDRFGATQARVTLKTGNFGAMASKSAKGALGETGMCGRPPGTFCR